jgi:NAD(P)-dependent dehydrogenase (short-subunit alcohol dehydrogenase family)
VLVSVLARGIELATEKDKSAGSVLVAGGTGGVGEAICLEFARRGAPVAFTYNRNRAKADELEAKLASQGGVATAQQLDLTDPAATTRVLDTVAARFGTLRSVVYAAGPAFEMAYVSKLTPKTWADVFAIDVNGCFNLFSSALQVFRRQGSGNLVALSTCALRRPPKADVLSAAPKAAIDMLTRTIAKEEGRNGIRANTVELGFIAAGIAARHMEHTWSAELTESIKRETPLRRFGRGEDIAKAVAFLCSDEACFITGQALAVDGGFSL